MKNKSLTSKLIPITILLVALFGTSTSSAHGPESSFEDACTENALDYWYENADYCDPGSPIDVSAGITIDESGPNYFPNGLCYPSFNNFIDASDPDDGWGIDPYTSEPPVFEDERNFLQATVEGDRDWDTYGDELEMQEGDQVSFMLYIHNTGNPCFNDGRDIPQGKAYSDWRTTSHNTKVNITPESGEFNYDQETGRIFINTNQGTTFKSDIWSSDAINAQGELGAITNDVTINTSENLILEYIPDSAKYVDSNEQWQTVTHNISQEYVEQLFGLNSMTNGMSLSTLTDRGEIPGSASTKGEEGDTYACEPYIAVIEFKFEIKEVEELICQQLNVTIQENGEGPNVEVLKPSTLYKISTDADPDGYDEQLIYSSGVWDSDPETPSDGYGVFIEDPLVALILGLRTDLTREEILTYGGRLTNVDQNQEIYFYTFPDIEESSADGLRIQADDGENDTCIKDFPIEVEAAEATCEQLNVRIQENGVGPYVEELKPNTIYSISSDADPDEYGEQLIYSTGIWNAPNPNEASGIFIEPGEALGLMLLPDRMTAEELLARPLNEGGPIGTIAPQTTNQNETIYFYTFSRLTENRDDALNVTAETFPLDGQCQEQFPINIPIETTCASSDLSAVTSILGGGEAVTCMDPENGQIFLLSNYYTDADGENEINEELITVHWTTTDPSGRFIDPNLVEHEESYEGLSNTRYIGGGTVRATLQSINGVDEEETVCTAAIPPCPPEEPKTCEQILVDYQDPIYTDTYSTFRSRAIDQDDENLENHQVHYSVDLDEDGNPYGVFSTTRPLSMPENDSEFEFNGGLRQRPLPRPQPGWGQRENDIFVENMIDIALGLAVEDERRIDESLNNIDRINPSDEIGPQFDEVEGRANNRSMQNNIFAAFDTEPEVNLQAVPEDQVPEDFPGDPEEWDMELTVDPGTAVYFYAFSPGTNVIHVITVDEDGNETGELNCEKDFSIIRPETVCESSTLEIFDIDQYIAQPDNPKPLRVQCLEEYEIRVLGTEFLDDSGQALDPSLVQVEWTSTDSTGRFADLNEESIEAYEEYLRNRDRPDDGVVIPRLPEEDPLGQESPFIGTQTVIYSGGGQVTARLSQYDGEAEPENTQCSALLEPCEQEEELTCAEVSGNVRHLSSEGPEVDVLEPNNLYYVNATTLYSDLTHQGTITYETNAGVFLTQEQREAGVMTDATAEELLAAGTGVTTIELPEGNPIYLYTNATPPAANNPTALTFYATNFEDTEDCYKAYTLVIEELICESIDINIAQTDGTAVVGTDLAPQTSYIISASAGYRPEDHDNTITYTANPGAGIFLTGAELDQEFIDGLEELGLGGLLPNLDLDGFTRTITVEEDEEVVFRTFSNVESNIADALRVQATGFFNPECDVLYRLVVQAPVCESIEIVPPTGGFDPARDQIINIRGDFEDHPGQIEVSVNGPGQVSKVTGTPSNSFTYTRGEVAASENTLTFVYRNAGDNYDPNLHTVEISVSAIGSADPDCIAVLRKTPTPENLVCLDLDITRPNGLWEIDPDDNEQRFEIDVDTSPANEEDQLIYHWKTNRGEWLYNSDGEWEYDNDDHSETNGTLFNYLTGFREGTEVEVWAEEPNGIEHKDSDDPCYDRIVAQEEDEDRPEIEKFVFPERDSDEADDLININEREDYVTFVVAYETGSEESVEITETKIDNGRIERNKGGYLKFEGMRINILEQDGNNEYTTLLKTDNYRDVNDNDSRFGDNRYDDDDDENNDIDDYEEKFSCDSRGNANDFCLEGDFEDAIEDFKEGRDLQFNNIDQIGDNSVILIKYQMEVHTVIDDEYCKTLTTLEGCGEEFVNEAEFQAYSDEFETETYDDDDSATVIVICPFILTRSGGDIFYHEIVDTGVDVAYCSKVKGSDGTGHTPETPEERENPTTGQGGEDSDELLLDLPSHDICRYSNQETNIEGYNDVLKNFSSTICELRASVAEEWTVKNIVDSISANVERISRWEGNLNTLNIALTNASQLESLENAQSGVFVKDSEKLIINGIGNTYTIEKSGNIVPAAQTYIIKENDLIINSNIIYGETNYSDPDKIPSAAFIVIDGNIIIDNDVKQIDGIVMAVSLNDPDKGKIMNNDGQTTENLLTINGSLIGDVYALFETRRGAGDPTKDEGSVTIKYDERILLNTPPGITELIDVTQLRVAN